MVHKPNIAPPMQQQKRMYKTLACLVAAMTSTTALLAWMDPAPPPPSDAVAADLLQKAESAVWTGVDVRMGQWRDVVIAAGRPADSAVYLTAPSNRPAYHFRVGLDGRTERSELWAEQDWLEQSPATVSIEVARRDATSLMTRAQWRCVRAIVEALGEAVHHPAGSPNVRLDGDWSRTYGVDEGTTMTFRPIK